MYLSWCIEPERKGCHSSQLETCLAMMMNIPDLTCIQVQKSPMKVDAAGDGDDCHNAHCYSYKSTAKIIKKKQIPHSRRVSSGKMRTLPVAPDSLAREGISLVQKTRRFEVIQNDDCTRPFIAPQDISRPFIETSLVNCFIRYGSFEFYVVPEPMEFAILVSKGLSGFLWCQPRL